MVTTGPFPDNLIVNCYWIGLAGNYIRYSTGLYTKTKSQLPKKMEDLFLKMTSRGTPVKYLRCDNAGEHQSKLQKACENKKLHWNI